MIDQWKQLKQTITEIKENNEFEKEDVTLLCKYLINYMGVLEKKMPGWIPVSERLPKPFEFVNCTCHSLIDNRNDWVVETVYIPQPQKSPYSDWGNIPMLNDGECEVIAWMHRDIPEPYQAESEE
jgi:hypothetical protein